MNDVRKIALATRRVHAIEGFYIHAGIFVITIGILVMVNLVLSDVWWVQWAILGWGLGLIGHAIGVFGGPSHRLQAWRDRKIREIVEKP
jgi:hypothetical protein